MRSRYIFVTMLSAILFAAIFALRAAGSLPQGGVTPGDPAPGQAAAGKPIEGQIDERTPITSTVEPAPTQAAQRQDGPELLEEHCTQCHTARMLEQVDQPQEGWEISLAKMETFGVRLDEDEKAILLDYLAVDEQP